MAPLAAAALAVALAPWSAPLQAADPDPGGDLDRALALHADGRFDEALALYRRSAPGLESGDAEGAAIARNNSCTILADRGEFRAALTECDAALRLRRAIDDPIPLARTLNNRGRALQALGRTAEAEASYTEAIALNRRGGDAQGEGINLANLGVVAIESGRFGRALDATARAVELARRHAGELWATEQERIARINQGVVFEKLGAFEEALDLYRSLLADETLLDPQIRASLIGNAGTIYRNLGDPRRAVAAYQEAAAIYARTGDRSGLSNARLNLGLARHLNLGELRAAEADFRAALAEARASGDRSEEIQDLVYLGRLLLDERRLDEAERAFREALALARESDSAEGRAAAREGLGRTAAALGETDRALAELRSAIEEVERTRAEIGGRDADRLRASYFGDRREVYAAAVELLGQRDRPEDARQALELAERAKVRELLDALGGGGGSSGARSVHPATAAEIERAARADGVPLLEYFAAENRLWLWLVDRHGLRRFDLGAAEPILAAAARIHRELAAGRTPQGSELADLGAKLLGPLGPLERVDRLRIAPDGALRYLPFEILPGADGRPLVERLAIAYLPSATAALALTARRAAVPARPFVGFGAPRVAADPGRPTPAGLLVARFGLGPLPGAARELAAAAERLGGSAAETFLADGATEAAFRREAVRGSRVVHLATHAVLDERPGRGAAILLSPAGSEDGLLEPAEIAALPMRAEVAVLSACSTALAPDPRRGGALASLSGAFLAAGASGVVASLWDVGDRATAAFMEQFYAQLARGLPPDLALAAAKRRLRTVQAWDRPEVWSAFVLIGEPRPIARRGRWWFALAGLSGALAGAALALARRRNA